MEDPRQAAKRLARKLASLPEPAMRSFALGDALRAVAPADAVRLLESLVRGARRYPGPPWSTALQALAAALEDRALVTYDVRSALYLAAKEAGLPEVARLFFAAGARPEGEPEEPDPEQPVTPRGKPLTLGERKSLARGGRRELLQGLMRDPDAAVIRVLLENPRLTERDVVLIAARRPVRGDVLKAVFASRWSARYHVRRALVMNPYTPSDIAVRLVTTLVVPDLAAVAADANLSAAVRSQARELLEARRADAKD